MVNEKPAELSFHEEVKKLKITPEVRKEIELLYDLGLDVYELEYLVYTKLREEIKLKET